MWLNSYVVIYEIVSVYAFSVCPAVKDFNTHTHTPCDFSAHLIALWRPESIKGLYSPHTLKNLRENTAAILTNITSDIHSKSG